MECPICHEINNKELFTTSCNHVFHKKCIDKWFKLKSTCPCCRTNLLFLYMQVVSPNVTIRRYLTRDAIDAIISRNFIRRRIENQ